MDFGVIPHIHPGPEGVHPELKANTAMFCRVQKMIYVEYPPKPYLERNRDIVDSTELLIACPKDMTESSGGTWATVRYARKQKKPIVVVWPDGSVTEENR
jgi:hypothetical protein